MSFIKHRLINLKDSLYKIPYQYKDDLKALRLGTTQDSYFLLNKVNEDNTTLKKINQEIEYILTHSPFIQERFGDDYIKYLDFIDSIIYKAEQ